MRLTKVLLFELSKIFSNSIKEGKPLLSIGRYINSTWYLILQDSTVSNTALCSIFVVIILSILWVSTAPFIIILFDSVPPDVNIISEGFTFNSSEIFFRVSSIIDLDSLPKEWIEDGLPKLFFITWYIISTTSFEIGVVAALSK